MFIKSFGLGDGSSGKYNFRKGVRLCWQLNGSVFVSIEKLQRCFIETWTDVKFKISDRRESFRIYAIWLKKGR